MKRHLFNLAAAVSLVMLLAVLGLWVRSLRVADIISFWRAGSWWSITSNTGCLYITTNYLPGFRPAKYGWTYRHLDSLQLGEAPPEPEFSFYLNLQITSDTEFLGFSLRREEGGWRSRPGAFLREVSVPLWFFTLPFAILGAGAAGARGGGIMIMPRNRAHILASLLWVVTSTLTWIAGLFVFMALVLIPATASLRSRGWMEVAGKTYNVVAVAGAILIPSIVTFLAVRARLPWTGARASNRRGFAMEQAAEHESRRLA